MLTAAAPSSTFAHEPVRTALLAGHAEYVAALPCGEQAKRLRRRGRERLLTAFPEPAEWMTRSVVARLAEVRRFDAWPFLSWAFATGALVPDLELLAAEGRGTHFTTWARFRAEDAARAQAAGRALGWCPEWITRIGVNALALVCMTRLVDLVDTNTWQPSPRVDHRSAAMLRRGSGAAAHPQQVTHDGAQDLRNAATARRNWRCPANARRGNCPAGRRPACPWSAGARLGFPASPHAPPARRPGSREGRST